MSRLAASPTFGGTFEPGHVENSYSLMSAGGGGWLILSLEFGPRDQVLAWADGILKRYPATPAIIGLYSMHLMLMLVVVGLVEIIVATLAGAYFYNEPA